MDKLVATTILKNKSHRDETCYLVAFTLSCDNKCYFVLFIVIKLLFKHICGCSNI